MSNPNYNKTITVYRRTPAKETSDKKEKWTRDVLSGCFWKCNASVNYSSTNAQKTNTYTVRIPMSVAGSGWTCRIGDIVVLGECDSEGSEAVLTANKPNAFKVTAFSDNTAWIGEHYRLEG